MHYINYMISLHVDYKNISTELCEIGAKYDVDASSQRKDVTNDRHCHPFTIFYDSLFKNYRNNNLNVGVLSFLNSNSLLMWDEYFPNANINGFEYNDEYINYFNQFIKNKDKVKLSKIDISNKDNINNIFNTNNLLYDIIIDDTTHIMEDQVRIIENTYNYLKPGGILIIEDIFKAYDENDYIKKLEHILSNFQEYYFISLDHNRRNSTGWDNDKLFVLIKNGNPIFKKNIKMTIITPSIRINNLIKIKDSINFEYVNEWIIVYDGNKIKDNPHIFMNDLYKDKIKEYVHQGQGISGNPQRNFALDSIEIKNTYLYFLDDDNKIHKDLYKLLNIIDDNKLFTFNQKDRINGNCIEVYYIDTAMMLIDYNLCKDIRWILDKYNADGFYIKECYLKNSDKWIYVNNSLCNYNNLCESYL